MQILLSKAPFSAISRTLMRTIYLTECGDRGDGKVKVFVYNGVPDAGVTE